MELKNVAQIRIDNLNAQIDRFKTRKAFCEAVGVAPAQLAQFYMDPENKGFRTPGREFCRKVEDALGLSANALDQPSYPAEHSEHRTENVLSFSTSMSKHLHVAVLEEIAKCLNGGVVDDASCAELLSKFVSMRQQNS